MAEEKKVIKTDVLIVGAGPAGAGAGLFLGEYGIDAIMISRAPQTSETPRAHITNAAAFECLRDTGIEDKALRNATKNDCMAHTRWCQSMLGKEYARIHSWGNDPARKGDYELASPCRHHDLPQTLLEPVMVREAAVRGVKVRFNTEFIKFVDNGEQGITTTVRDIITDITYDIHSKYLIGADGARSRIVKQLQLPLVTKPGQGFAVNLLVEADLEKHMQFRKGNLHWIMQHDRELPKWGDNTLWRMVNPWKEWMVITLAHPSVTNANELQATEEEHIRHIKLTLGRDDIPIKLKHTSVWTINEIYAENYSVGRVHCFGDATHRHPPFNGLGSNTCIQDAYNIAWKLAYVIKGLAGPELLDSFSPERQPVGAGVVERANDGLRDHIPVFQAFGVLEPGDAAARAKALAALNDDTVQGVERRKAFKTAIQTTAKEFHALGIEMNQRYTNTSNAIYVKDEASPHPPPFERDPLFYYEPSTYPGCRLPHAWLSHSVPDDAPMSTHDLAGKQAFTIFTGIGGSKWKGAADGVTQTLGLQEYPIRTRVVGLGQEWYDMYFAWDKLRGVEEDGCVLVRPDRYVAWRSSTLPDDPEAKLLQVVKSLLSRK